MPKGEKLFRFPAYLARVDFHGTVAIRCEAGGVAHVETETGRVWQYKDLPEENARASGSAHGSLA